jgi:hypothetical protein
MYATRARLRAISDGCPCVVVVCCADGRILVTERRKLLNSFAQRACGFRSTGSRTEPQGVSAIRLRSLAQIMCRSPEALALGAAVIHAGAAITTPNAGALLTGLTTALGRGSRRHFLPASLSLPRAGCLCLPFAPRSSGFHHFCERRLRCRETILSENSWRHRRWKWRH